MKTRSVLGCVVMSAFAAHLGASGFDRWQDDARYEFECRVDLTAIPALKASFGFRRLESPLAAR